MIRCNNLTEDMSVNRGIPQHGWQDMTCQQFKSGNVCGFLAAHQKSELVFLFLKVYAFPRPFPPQDGTLLLFDP